MTTRLGPGYKFRSRHKERVSTALEELNYKYATTRTIVGKLKRIPKEDSEAAKSRASVMPWYSKSDGYPRPVGQYWIFYV